MPSDEIKTAKRATINDVAKRAGVSIGTVSRVLNNTRNVEQSLRHRVLQAAEALKYQADFAAQSMRSKHTRVIGVLVPDFQNPLASAAVSGIEQELANSGYTLFLANSRYDGQREERILHEFNQRRVDGVIAMLARDDDPATLEHLRRLRMPLVLIQREMDIDADSVYTNQIEGSYRATRYLLGMGHSRIGFITVPLSIMSGRHRLQGYERAFADTQRDVDYDIVKTGGYSHAYALEAAYSLLAAPTPPTALIVSGSLLAGTIEAARQLHINIPEKLSIITLGDTELAALTIPPITAVRYDWAEIGQIAGRLMIGRIAGETGEKVKQLLVPYEFVIRQSCVSPPIHSPSSSKLIQGNGVEL